MVCYDRGISWGSTQAYAPVRDYGTDKSSMANTSWSQHAAVRAMQASSVGAAVTNFGRCGQMGCPRGNRRVALLHFKIAEHMADSL